MDEFLLDILPLYSTIILGTLKPRPRGLGRGLLFVCIRFKSVVIGFLQAFNFDFLSFGFRGFRDNHSKYAVFKVSLYIFTVYIYRNND